MQINRSSDSSSWASSPSPQWLDVPPPPTLPPAAVAQSSWLPHSLTSPPGPWRGEIPPRGGWAVTSGQWDLGWGAPRKEGRVGPTDNGPSATSGRTTVPLVVPWAEPEEEEGDGMVEWGQAWGWNGEECVQGMQPEPKGTIPTTAAKLCQSQPKRNTQEGRKPQEAGRRQRGGGRWWEATWTSGAGPGQPM